MTWRGLSALLSLALVLSALPATAKVCGDAVDGQDVPCACGDIVVSDLALDDDPVAEETCEHDGLTVRALQAAQGVTVDLRGKTLKGSGHGAGLWLLDGGPGGARIVSSTGAATLQGFRDGIVAHGPQAVALIENVVALGNVRDGVRAAADHYEIRNTTARLSGRDGFALTGDGFHVVGTRAEQGKRHGYFVTGNNGAIGDPGAGAVAEGNGGYGFSLMGMGHRVRDCAATGNGDAGMYLWGMHYDIHGCTVRENADDGIEGMGMDWWLSRNQALDNGNNGIVVGGVDVIDAGGNSGSGNKGEDERGEAIQCEISGRPCR